MERDTHSGSATTTPNAPDHESGVGTRGGSPPPRPAGSRVAPRVIIVTGMVVMAGADSFGFRTNFSLSEHYCDINPGMCLPQDDARDFGGLSGWWLVGLVVVLAGVAWAVGRRGRGERHGGPARSSARRVSAVSHVLVAGAGTLVVGAILILPGLDPAAYLNAKESGFGLIGWWLVLAWLLDLVHRRVAVRDGPSWALLQSLLAAGLAVAASALLFVASPDAWFKGSGIFLIPGAQACVVLAVVSLGRIARSRADEGAPRLAAVGMGLGALAVVALIAAIWLAVQVPPVPAESSSAVPPAGTADLGTAALSPSLHATAPGPEGQPNSTVAASRPCAPADLVWGPVGIDRAMGSAGLATVQVTSTSDVACYVEGFAGLTLIQGGDDLHLLIVQQPESTVLPARRVGLARGDRAAFYVAWKGYGAAADQRTSQTLWVSIGGSEGRPIRLDSAPFDLVDGGEVTLTQWFYVGPA